MTVSSDLELWQPTPSSTMETLRQWRTAITEDGIIDFVASLSPWLAPLPSAVFVYDAAAKHLHSNDALSVVIAVVIETLGLTTTHTALAFYGWNRAHAGEETKQAPFTLACILAGTYVLATLILIGVLETFPNMNSYAPMMFPILSVVGAVNLAMRGHHNHRVREERTDKSTDRNRKWQIEDEKRKDTQELKRLRVMAKLGLPINNSVNDSDFDTVDRQQRMMEGRQRKTEARRAIVAAMLAEGKAVQDIVAAKVGSLNTIKADVAAIQEVAK